MCCPSKTFQQDNNFTNNLLAPTQFPYNPKTLNPNTKLTSNFQTKPHLKSFSPGPTPRKSSTQPPVLAARLSDRHREKARGFPGAVCCGGPPPGTRTGGTGPGRTAKNPPPACIMHCSGILMRFVLLGIWKVSIFASVVEKRWFFFFMFCFCFRRCVGGILKWRWRTRVEWGIGWCLLWEWVRSEWGVCFVNTVVYVERKW